MKVLARQLASFLVMVAASSGARKASASWLETHVMSDDIHVEVERSGAAVIDHAITMRVHGGPLRSFDLVGVDADAAPLPDATVISAQSEGLLGLPIPLSVSLRPDGALRINVDSPRGVMRGLFLFHVRYRTNLLAKERVERDGAMLRIRWTGPSFPDGIDNARCTFVLPSAPTEPRVGQAPALGTEGAADLADDEEGASFLSTFKRWPDRDELELVRLHMARGEAVTWSLRVDPRALGQTGDPRLRVPPPAPPRPLVPEPARVPLAALASGLMLVFSTLVGIKARQVARATQAAGVKMRPLLPIGTSLRILFAGPLFAAGVVSQLALEDPRWGTGLVLLSMALSTYLHPKWRPEPRGPGQWLPLSDEEAFAPPLRPRHAWLDASTRGGAIGLVFGVALCLAAAYFVRPLSSYVAYVILFDGAILFPLFGTGRRSELPPDPIAGPGFHLFPIARGLRKLEQVRTSACARLLGGSTRFDELRLLAAPRLPRRGFLGIEIGCAPFQGSGGFIQLPEILVRVIDGSPCHEAFVRLFPQKRWVRGRKADERVAIVCPRLPTTRMTIALAARLLDHARDPQAPRSLRPPAPDAPMPAPGGAPRFAESDRHRPSRPQLRPACSP
jgi:hypothetical protein